MGKGDPALNICMGGSTLSPPPSSLCPPYCQSSPFSALSIPQGSMIQAIERYMKQALVDKNPAVSSAALVSAWVCVCGCVGVGVSAWMCECGGG